MKNKKIKVFSLVLCCCIVLSFSSVAFAATDVTGYINDTYTYEKGSDSAVLSDTEAKSALKAETDLLILGAGRNQSSVVDFSKYLGYVNANIRNGNGSYTIDDFLRAALAVGTCGNATNVGKDANGNIINLMYKGLYPYSYTTVSQSPTRLAYALLAIDANGISDSAMEKVSRSQLKQGVLNSIKTNSDVFTGALLLQAYAPYYRHNQGKDTCNQLLTKLVNANTNTSCKATAMLVTAVCEMGLDPENIESRNLLNDLLAFKQEDGGFSATVNGSSEKEATNYARIALVAYHCAQSGSHFYIYDGCKDYDIAKITVSSNTTAKNSNSGTTTSKSSSSSSSSTTKKSSGTSSNSSSSKSSSSSSSSSKSSSSSNSNNSSSSNSSSSTGSASSSAATTVKHTSADGTTIKKEEFDKIKGQNTTLIYEGTWAESEPYTLSFNGKNITTAKDFNALIDAEIEHQTEIEAAAGQSEYFRFQQTDDFPGKATVTITVSLADGSYLCYHYNDNTGTFEEIGSAVVNSGMATFEATVGGDYFLTQAEEDVAETGQFMSLEDTIDGIVPASVFEGIQGKEVDLTLDGKTDRDISYLIVFNGENITTPQDFNMKISEDTSNKEKIAALSDSPSIIHFEQDGEIPGDATVTLFANLDASKTYGLYYYNEETGEGEYIGDVEVGDGEFSFMIQHCCDYFIAEGESAAILKKSVPVALIVLLIILFLLLAGGIGGYFILRKKGISLISLIKGKNDKSKERAETAALIEDQEDISYQENITYQQPDIFDETESETELLSDIDTEEEPFVGGFEDAVLSVPAESQVSFAETVYEKEESGGKDFDMESFARPEDE